MLSEMQSSRDRRLPMADRDVFKAALERAFGHALRHLAGANNRPVGATIDLAQLRERFDRPLPHAGTDPIQVIDDLARDTEGGIIGCTGGRFFGWVIGGTLPAAVAADRATLDLDQRPRLPASGAS